MNSLLRKADSRALAPTTRPEPEDPVPRPHPTRLRLAHPLACSVGLALAFALGGCSSPGQRDADAPVKTAEAASLPTLEFRIVVEPGTPGSEALPYEDGTLQVGPPRLFQVAEASSSTDELGFPAVHFELVDAEQAAFRTWTRENTGHQMALVHDGRILTAPHLHSELPGSGLISGGPNGMDDVEIGSLLRALQPGS